MGGDTVGADFVLQGGSFQPRCAPMSRRGRG